MDAIAVRNANEITAKNPLTAGTYQDFINYLDASPKTVQTYTRALKQFYVWATENGKLSPTREDILAYRTYLTETGHKPTTVQNYITAVRLFFSWTGTNGLYPNVADHVKGAKLDRNHKKDYLTSTQTKAVLSKVDRTTVKGKRDYAILALMITGGLRTIEISRANIEDLRTVGDFTALFIQGKGREEKTEYVKIVPAVEQAIRDYLKERPNAQPTAPLFASTSHNSKGGRLTTRSVSEITKDHLVDAGYDSERLTAHSLRHTAVTLALINGADIQEAQQFARHANVQTTLIYAHNLEKAQNTCGAKIADAIF